MKKLRVNLDDFELAFEAGMYPLETYLDRETGKVHLFQGRTSGKES